MLLFRNASLRFPRRKERQSEHSSANSWTSSPRTEKNQSSAQLRRATRTRKSISLLTSFLLLLAWIFLLLVEIGSVRNQTVLRDIYFLKLALKDIIPRTIPNARLLNSIAQTLGLHDFYTVGLWNFCKGYDDYRGTTECSATDARFWFNPISILQEELISGATINLPGNIEMVLDVVRTASHAIFAFFIIGICLTTVSIFLMPLAIYSRWASLGLGSLAILNFACITIASVVATVLFVIFRNVVRSVPELNIDAYLGTRMFVFMWLATGFSIAAGILQTALCCCCTSRRTARNNAKRVGKKEGIEKE